MILVNNVDFRLNILFLKGLNDSQVYAKRVAENFFAGWIAG